MNIRSCGAAPDAQDRRGESAVGLNLPPTVSRSRFLLTLVLGALQSCAATTEPGLLVPDASFAAVLSDSSLRGSIALGEVRGEKKLDILGSLRVGNRELAEALRLSLGARGLLAGPERPARFRLTAFLADATLAAAGMDVTGRALVRYTLSDAAGGVFLDELVRSSYTVTFAQELIGLTRDKRAMEGVFRANIAAFLELLARFRPPDSAGRPGAGGAVK